MSKTLFFEELIFLDEQFETSRELFEKICPRLLAGGWVEKSFQEAVIAREKDFATGLQTEPVAVAIPHTDAEHVKKSFIAFVRLSKEIAFEHMGIPGQEVLAKFVFILGIAEQKKQVVILSNMIATFADLELMDTLLEMKNKKDIQLRLNAQING
ncbi:PTS sugar transporter subunit IIA [Enterococcus avium]|uniref:PTS sugar transporter subunit IIA n=1 Tax=Enterococcus avium TaxID=33945 RepID=UPI00379BB557